MKNGRRYYAFLFERGVVENKERPLIENFWGKISIKNGLRIKCYAPHPSPFGDTFPRGGRLYQRQKLKFQMVLLQSVMKRAMGTISAALFEMFLSENKERPLIENFRGKISIKNGLCIKCYAP